MALHRAKWPTWVDSDSDLQPFLRHVFDGEHLDALEEGQRHPADLHGVSAPVPDGQARHHHVRVANSLHLEGESRQNPTL